MTTYKRGKGNFIVGILSAPAAAFFLFLLLGNFLSLMLTIIISLLIFLSILYITIFSDNIKFVIDDDRKTMSYYEKGKLIKEYQLKKSVLTYHMKLGHSSVIDLTINGESIDCEPLGRNQFERMYKHLQKLVGVEPIILKVGE